MSRELLVQLWVIISAGGFVLSVSLIVESWQDIHALGSTTNGRLAVARSRFTRESIRATVQWTWFLLGLSVLLGVDVGTKAVLSLLYGNLAMVVNSLIDAQTRSLIYRTRGREPDIPHT